jgi:hypothetical protein
MHTDELENSNLKSKEAAEEMSGTDRKSAKEDDVISLVTIQLS